MLGEKSAAAISDTIHECIVNGHSDMHVNIAGCYNTLYRSDVQSWLFTRAKQTRLHLLCFIAPGGAYRTRRPHVLICFLSCSIPEQQIGSVAVLTHGNRLGTDKKNKCGGQQFLFHFKLFYTTLWEISKCVH